MTKLKLSDLEFESNYDNFKQNVASEFYYKALKAATNYDRIAAYFDSKILAYYSEGIENLYENQGKIRFIFSEQINESDFEKIKEGYKNRLIRHMENNFEREPLNEHDKVRLSNLAFLIEQGFVDIKIAFVSGGIFHDKIGLIYDDEGNRIYFRGSNNETVAALLANHESFEVSCNWYTQEKENEKIERATDVFEQLRNNTYDERIFVVDAKDVVYKKIAKYNNGKLILGHQLDFSDAIIADITDDEEFIVTNNLKDHADFERTFAFNSIKRKVKNHEGFVYKFGKINYIKIGILIEDFTKLADNIKKNFYVTDKLEDYLEKRKYYIKEFKELGKFIKKQDSYVAERFLEFSNIVNKEMERELRPKQMWDAYFIKEMIKSANYSVPGSGKTSIVYGAYSYLTSPEKHKIDTMVVVGPISSFKSWIDEFKECFGNKRKLSVLNLNKCKSKEEKRRELKFNSYDLILVNYEGLDSIKDELKEFINSRTLLVYDEVHKVKSITGVWANAAKHICGGAIYKVVLTGTPIPNSYADLFNQFNILYTDEYDSFFHMSPLELSSKDPDVMDKVNEMIYPFFCRTTKKDLKVPTPDPDYELVSEMDEKEQKLFAMLHRKYYRIPLLLYIRLLQASNNPALLLKQIDKKEFKGFYEEDDEVELNADELKIINDDLLNIEKAPPLEPSEKEFIKTFDMTSKFWMGINKIEELVNDKSESEKGKSVLVRGIFVDTINKISEELDKRGISNKIIYGSVPPEEREKIIEGFKKKEFSVLITNPHTMAESVSLHRDCHDAVYFEYSFNLTHMLQSRDRINRLGLPEGQYTRYYYLFLNNESGRENSIDRKTYDRLKEKEKIMLDAIEGERLISIDFSIRDDLDIIMSRS